MIRDPRIRLALLAVVAVSTLSVGLWLIIDHRRSIPPDLQSADTGELIEFMLTGYFNRLPAAQQKMYSEAAMRRYAKMSAEQRKTVDDRVAELRRDDPKELQRQSIRVWKQFVVAEAEQYVALPLSQRTAWLDGRIKLWKAMMPPPSDSPEQRQRREEERRRQDEPMSAQTQGKIIQFFQETVWPAISAKERALVTVLMRDAAPKMAPR
jgi:hypothetical protein